MASKYREKKIELKWEESDQRDKFKGEKFMGKCLISCCFGGGVSSSSSSSAQPSCATEDDGELWKLISWFFFFFFLDFLGQWVFDFDGGFLIESRWDYC